MRKLNKKGVSLLVSFLMFFGLIFSSFTNVMAEGTNTGKMSEEQLNKFREEYFSRFKVGDSLPDKHDENEVVRIIVELEKPSVSELFGEGAIKTLSERQIEGVASDVLMSQDQILANVENNITGEFNIHQRYSYLVNGFSADVRYGDISEVEKTNGVKKVYIAKKYHLDMNDAVDMTLDKQTVWEELGYKGEGVVVSIIDSGIDYLHQDFRLSSTTGMALNEEKINELLETNPNIAKGKFYSNKIPFGYNYADKNEEVRPAPGVTNHGVHVAGIVGANSESQEKMDNLDGIRGVAPECQLLAMKVFSNHPPTQGKAYAWQDAVVAAIEDSVRLGADIINLSIGADAGFEDISDLEQKAIKEASEQGTICVVSAGNAYFSTAFDYFPEAPDTGLVGAPGIGEYSFTIASAENVRAVFPSVKVYAGDNNEPLDIKVAYQVTDYGVSAKMDKKLEAVYCGLGGEEDFKKVDVKGKCAFIKRGTHKFTEKFTNAFKAGAAAAILFNEDGNDELWYVGAGKSPIDSAWISNTAGQAILNQINLGNKVYLQFTEDPVSVINSDKGKMSDFSSWGPAPDLDFKPQLTGAGGNIWSTINDGYTNKSGTSMAAPYVAGSLAVILQGLRDKDVELEDLELVNYLKALTMNTAKPLKDADHNKILFSPRRQGAGFISVNNALKNDVLVTCNGKPSIALKEVKGNEVEIELELKNYGKEDVSYSLSHSEIMTNTRDYDGKGMEYVQELKGATIEFDQDEITVTTGAAAKVKATIKLAEDTPRDGYVEGYIKFLSKNPEKVNLSIPYMGYVGEWDEVPILDNPLYTEEAVLNKTAVYGVGMFGVIQLGFAGYDDKDKRIYLADAYAVNPSSIFTSSVVPFITQLRNTEYLQIDIIDEAGNFIKSIDRMDWQSKNFAMFADDPYKAFGEWAYNCTKYDQAINNNKVLPDGQYYYRFRTRAAFEDAIEQELKLPFKVDTNAPKVEIKSSDMFSKNTYKLQFEASDNGNELYLYDIVVTDLDSGKKMNITNMKDSKTADTMISSLKGQLNKDGLYEFEIPLDVAKNFNVKIEASVYDGALNDAKDVITIKQGEERKNYEMKITSPLDNPIVPVGDEITVKFAGNENFNKDLVALQYGIFKDGATKPVKVANLENAVREFKLENLEKGDYKVTVLGKVVEKIYKGETVVGEQEKVLTDSITFSVSDTKGRVIIDTLKEGKQFTENPIPVTGRIVGRVKALEINGINVEGINKDNATFAFNMPIAEEGYVKVPVKITYQDDSVYEYAINIFVDSKAPEFTFNNVDPNMVSDDLVIIQVQEDETHYTLTGSFNDIATCKFYYNNEFVGNISEYPYEFTREYELKEKYTRAFFRAVDQFGSESNIQVIIVKGDLPKPIQLINNSDMNTFKNGSQAKLTVAAKNILNSPVYATFIVALYTEDGLLVNVMANGQEFDGEEVIDVTSLISIPAEGKYKVKVFVWDSLDAGTPLSEVLEFNVEQ